MISKNQIAFFIDLQFLLGIRNFKNYKNTLWRICCKGDVAKTDIFVSGKFGMKYIVFERFIDVEKDAASRFSKKRLLKQRHKKVKMYTLKFFFQKSNLSPDIFFKKSQFRPYFSHRSKFRPQKFYSKCLNLDFFLMFRYKFRLTVTAIFYGKI